jgi:CBS domain containing-hemolysin-like protein
MDLWLIFVVITLLIGVNGLYVAAEFSAVSAKRPRLAQLADTGDTNAQLILDTVNDPRQLDVYIAASQVGITLSSLLLGFYGPSTIVTWARPYLQAWGGMSTVVMELLLTVGVLLLLALLQVILSEWIPKNLGLQYPERVVTLTAVPMRWSSALFRPMIALLNGTGRLLLRLFGLSTASAHIHVHSPEEIVMLVEESSAGGVLDQEERRLLVNTLQLRHRKARHVMVPRNRIFAASIEQPIEELFQLLASSPYSRLPLYNESIDTIVGIVHIKDLLPLYQQMTQQAQRTDGERQLSSLDVRAVMHPVLYVPDSLSIEEVMAHMQRSRHNMAIVVDEYGGTAGLLAFEDLVEQIIGDFQDEFDADDPTVRLRGDDQLLVRGSVLVDVLGELLGIHLPSDDVDTVGGLVISQLGRIPTKGEALQIGDLTLYVEQMEQNHVAEVRIKLTPEQITQVAAVRAVSAR